MRENTILLAGAPKRLELRRLPRKIIIFTKKNLREIISTKSKTK